jgi:putative ABC transport system permease protein
MLSFWRHFTRGVYALTHRATADREVADELQHYFDEAAEQLIHDGLSPDEARRAVRTSLGSPISAFEEVRASGWENLIGTTAADARHALRRLRHAPGFASLSVLTLAIGIGASTAIFSAVNPILFEPLPYREPHNIITVWDRGVDGARLDVTFGTFREILERSRSFEAIAVMKPWLTTATGSDRPERLSGQRVSSQYFRVLAASPALGREFVPAEDLPNGPSVVILSDGLWQRRFNRDRGILGRAITLDDVSYTVIGIMPAAFENVLSPAAELWAPLQYNPVLSLEGREWGHHLQMAARVRADIGVVQAQRELDTIASAPLAGFVRAPWAAVARGFIVRSLKEDVTAAVKPALLAVFGAVALMLAIVCVNVTNLMLARGAQRRGEFAVRAALGASRVRMVRHLLTESLLVTGLGGALGMIVAAFSVQTLVALTPATVPRVNAIRVDNVALLFGLTVTTLVGVAIGLIPAFRASAIDLRGSVQYGSTRVAGDHHTIRRALVVAEVALALVLLVSAGLLMRSVQRLFSISPGFDASHVLTMQVQTAGRRFDKPTSDRFFAQAAEAVRRVPGVAAAAFTSQLPLSGDSSEFGVLFEPTPEANTQGGLPAFRYSVSPGYIEALGIPLRSGRLLEASDDGDALRVALISDSLAKRFAGRDLVGARIRIGSADMPWYTIVGIVGDVKQTSLSADRADAVYVTPEQWTFPDNPRSLVARAHGNAAALAPAIREAIWSVDKDQPITRTATMDDLVTETASERRFALILFEAFSVIALLLSAIGIYGVLAGSVTERTREIGVRAALGATRASLLTLVLRQGLALTAFGAAIGLAGGALASRGLVTLLFNTSRFDLMTYSGVAALLVVVATLACWIPAWRAARVDPAVALRAE